MIAGLDIGNSTTELVLFDPDSAAGEGPLLIARRRTRGEKGSEQSLIAAADLIASVERRHRTRVDAIAVCELAPVRLAALDPVAERRLDAGVVRLDPGGTSTPGGAGSGAGSLVSLTTLVGEPTGELVVVAVAAGVGFEQAAVAINAARDRGWQIVAALAAADEGVLIANRLDEPIPVVDEAAVSGVPEGRRVIVEVAPPGARTPTLGDPLALATALELRPDALTDLAPFTRALAGARSGAVAVGSGMNGAAPDSRGWVLEYVTSAGDNARAVIPDELDRSRGLAPGRARRLVGDGVELNVSDVWTLHLPSVAHELRTRAGAVQLDASLIATLSARPAEAVADRLAALTGRPVESVGPEASAARRGALTSPNAPRDALVCDLGGGTIDLIGGGWHRVAAGAGEMLTAAVSYALGVSRIAAEYVKRAPAMRMETQVLALHESGERAFRDVPVPSALVSWLCAQGPGRLLPFSRDLSPGEWRALRLALKEHVIADNIRRCLDAAADDGRPLLLCGGGADDDELVEAVTDGLREARVPVSRANVAGRCGPRYAVAVGAALSMNEPRGATP